MNAIILLLFAADPTGLQAAFESAETVDLSYDWTGFKVTLVNPETIKKLAPLVEVKGEAIKSNGLPATQDLVRVTIRGKKTTEFWMIRSKIAFGDQMLIDPANEKLWVALRAYFEPVDSPTMEEAVQKTFSAAMKSALKLDITYRGVTIPFGNTEVGLADSNKAVLLQGLELMGDVTQNAKKPEDAVEIAFVNKETRIPIFFVGDTAYWGDKRWKSVKSVKLTRDSMWKQMVRLVPSKESLGIKPDPDDSAGLKAAIESADSMEATRVGGETEQFKGSLTLKKEDIKDWGKFGLVVGKPVSYYGKDEPDAIDIVVKKGRDSRKYRLVGDTLVFDKDRAVTMENKLLLFNLIQRLQKTSR